VLNVAGNPFTLDKETDYRAHIISVLPGLMNLDYVFIDQSDRLRIRESDEKFRIDTTQSDYYKQMESLEQLSQEKVQEQRKKKDARMDFLDNLHSDLTKNEDLEKIKVIKRQAIEEEIGKYRDVA